jgi:polar amino acid transport system substrate-binding protein
MAAMERRRLLQLGAGMALGLPAQAANAPFSVVTAHLPPLVMEGGRQRGALRELVEELFRRMALSPRMDFRPWPRALMMATTRRATAIFPLTRIAAREPQFRWLAPIYEENYIFLAPRTSRFDISRPREMKEMRISLIRGAAQAAMLRELGFHNMVEAKSVDEVHRFLLGGMADAAIGERGIIANALRTRRAEKDFHTSEPVRSTTAWLAGSLDFTEDDARRFQRTMHDITSDGTARRILAAYQLV